MPEPEKTPEPEPRADGQKSPVIADPVIRVEGVEDSRVRPGRVPVWPPVSKEDLAKIPSGKADEVILLEGVEDTTIRPRSSESPLHPPRRPSPFPPLTNLFKDDATEPPKYFIYFPLPVPRPTRASRPRAA
jgi:hypothetical protein